MQAQKAQRVLKARAIVINEKSVGESNKQLTLLAKDMGKLIVSAKGAKNQKSKFLSGAQQFCYCDFMLYEGGGFTAVTQIDLIRNFAFGCGDIFKLMYGSYFMELIDKSVMLSQEANDIMLLLLKSLHMLEKTENPKKAAAVFQIKLLDYLGFSPETGICAACGAKTSEEVYFLPPHGLVCRSCGGSHGKISADALAAIHYVESAKSPNRCFMFEASEAVLNELCAVCEALVADRLEMSSNSLEIIKKL